MSKLAKCSTGLVGARPLKSAPQLNRFGHVTPRQRNARSALDQKIEHVPTDHLRPYQRRARTHSDDQIGMIMGSLNAFGFINPIIVDGGGRVLAGHGRWQAAKRLEYSEVPVVRIDHLSEDEIRAYVIADNGIATKAGWDSSILAIEFQHLSTIDLGFDLDVTGFKVGEIDLVIGEAEAAVDEADPADEIPDVSDGKAVSRPGDLWLLGKHRLFCGSALEAQSYKMLMAGGQARMALTDPPYNLEIDGFVSGLGKTKHREFAMGSGEMSEAEFVAFLATALGRMKECLLDGGLVYAFMDHRHLFELQTAAREAHLKNINLCVWNKVAGGMGSFYRSQHELCLVLKAGEAGFLNNVELGRHGRNRTNVWSHPGLSTFGRGRDEALANHPTVKPVALLAEAIKDCSKRGEIVLDPFLGSGSTLIAAERTRRRGYGVEIDPHYVDTIVARWERLTGDAAIHATTGLSFAKTGEHRSADEAGGDPEKTRVTDPLHLKMSTPTVRVRHRERFVSLAMEASNG